MSDIFANTTIFSEQEISQNWFDMSNKIERFEPNYQPSVFDESLIIKNEDHIEVHANSFFNKDASFNTYRENTQVQRKSSEELWSLCDLTSQDDVYCIDKEYNETITIHESAKIDHQKSKLSGDDLDRFNKKISIEKSDDEFHTINEEEYIYLTPKVKLCMNRRDVVIKSILRAMRKYYSNIIEKKTKFDRKLRNNKLKQEMLINGSIDLINKIDFSYGTKGLPFYLSIVAFPNDMKKLLKRASIIDPINKAHYMKFSSEANNIDNTLIRYSKKTLSDFLSKPEYSILLLNYLNKIKNPEYEEHCEILRSLATNSLKNWKNSKDSSSDNLEVCFTQLLTLF